MTTTPCHLLEDESTPLLDIRLHLSCISPRPPLTDRFDIRVCNLYVASSLLRQQSSHGRDASSRPVNALLYLSSSRSVRPILRSFSSSHTLFQWHRRSGRRPPAIPVVLLPTMPIRYQQQPSRAVLGSSRSAECTRTSSTEVIYPFVLQCRRAMLQLRHLLLVLALPLKPALPWHIALLSHALLRYSPFTATPSPQPIPLTVSPLRVSSNRVVYLTMGCCAVLSECAICIKRTEWRHSESVTHRLDS